MSNPKDSFEICGLLGIIQIEHFRFLGVVTDRDEIGHMQQHYCTKIKKEDLATVFQCTQVRLLALDNEEEIDDRTLAKVAHLEEFLASSFIFSYATDLSSSYQRRLAFKTE